MVARGIDADGVQVDVAFAGAIYASVPAAALGLSVTPDALPDLIVAGRG